MRNRKFGVEIEFDSNDYGYNGINDILRTNNIFGWNIGYDGSELELKSPILEGPSGFKELKEVVNILNSLGCFTTNSDGFHVHHDAPEFIDDRSMILKLLKSWEKNQDNVAKFIEPARVNRSYSPCPPIRENHIRDFETRYPTTTILSTVIAYSLPRGNLNCQSLGRHGTIELRYHEGTLNIDHIESWVRFGQSFINGVVARKKPIERVDSPIVLMNRLKTSKKAQAILLSKAISHGHSTSDLGLGVVYA